jgi:hypothetical protein
MGSQSCSEWRVKIPTIQNKTTNSGCVSSRESSDRWAAGVSAIFINTRSVPRVGEICIISRRGRTECAATRCLVSAAVTPVRVSRTQKFIADDLTDMAFVITVDVRFASTEKLAGEPGRHAWWWRCGSATLIDLSDRFAVDANANRTANLSTGSRQNLKL